MKEREEKKTFGEIKQDYFAFEEEISQKQRDNEEVSKIDIDKLLTLMGKVARAEVQLLKKLLVILIIFSAGFYSGCATAEAIGLGLGRTLQAAGEDTQKIVHAVSRKDNVVNN